MWLSLQSELKRLIDNLTLNNALDEGVVYLKKKIKYFRLQIHQVWQIKSLASADVRPKNTV